jgi:hypothetical protein
MIVSAGYFSSRRAPSFQSSHETADITDLAISVFVSQSNVLS